MPNHPQRFQMVETIATLLDLLQRPKLRYIWCHFPFPPFSHGRCYLLVGEHVYDMLIHPSFLPFYPSLSFLSPPPYSVVWGVASLLCECVSVRQT